MIYQNNTLIVCPNATKIKILNEQMQDDKLYNIKFMTKEEFKNNYFYSYDDETLYYLLKKYNYNLDVAKIYLKNLYVIDENKDYKNPKLVFLKNLKIELLKENLLKQNKSFKEFIKNKNIIVLNYYDLDKYEEEALHTNLVFPKTNLTTKVVECKSLEEEVNYVCLKILSLLATGVDITKISLTNPSNDYYYTLNKLFKYYKIPLNIDFKDSIYTTKIVKDYLETKELDLEDKNKLIINQKLVSILSSLSTLEDNTKEYYTLLIDKLKHTYIPVKKKNNAVNIKDLYSDTFTNDEHVFVLGFNQDILPKMEKDIAYINDALKSEVPLYTTSYLNKRNKEALTYILGNIDNLYLSYKLSSPFSNFYKSSLITDLKLEIISPSLDKFNASDLYNRLRLAEKLDLYHLYGEKEYGLESLYSHYKIPYNSYSNKSTKINTDTYLTNFSILTRIRIIRYFIVTI